VRLVRSGLRSAVGIGVIGAAIALSTPAWADITSPTSDSTISATPQVSGTARSGNQIRVSADDGKKEIAGCKAVVSGDGTWSCTFKDELQPGTWDIYAQVIDSDEVVDEYSVQGVVVLAAIADTSTPTAQPTATATQELDAVDSAALPRTGNPTWPYLIVGASLIIIGSAAYLWYSRARRAHR
jgi:LPXTG-motif cell wall-anchored protein